jgi:hypothetical protein
VHSLFTAVYALLGFASSLKPGSWVNYYTFFILFGSLLSVVFFHRFLNQFRASYFLILAVIITGGVFWFRQIYFYTLPYLKDSGPKADYAAVYNASVKIKNVLELKKGDHVIIANQLLRTFLFEYSVMVNTEYYGLSGFNYDKFRAKNDKEVDYIIASTEEAGIISFLSSTFEIETTSYLPVQEINNFIIYGKEGKLP